MHSHRSQTPAVRVHSSSMNGMKWWNQHLSSPNVSSISSPTETRIKMDGSVIRFAWYFHLLFPLHFLFFKRTMFFPAQPGKRDRDNYILLTTMFLNCQQISGSYKNKAQRLMMRPNGIKNLKRVRVRDGICVSNSFYVVFYPILASIPNFIKIGKKNTEVENIQ